MEWNGMECMGNMHINHTNWGGQYHVMTVQQTRCYTSISLMPVWVSSTLRCL